MSSDLFILLNEKKCTCGINFIKYLHDGIFDYDLCKCTINKLDKISWKNLLLSFDFMVNQSITVVVSKN